MRASLPYPYLRCYTRLSMLKDTLEQGRLTTDEALERQFFGYSAGLTAFYMSILMSSPAYVWRILRFIPPGLRRVLANSGSGGQNGPPPAFPGHLLRAGRRGLLRGAWLYLTEVRRQRHAQPTNSQRPTLGSPR